GERARGAPRGLRARGVDEIRHGFRLGEVEAIVEEGAPREFARLREAGAEAHAPARDLAQHHRAAMALQLEDVLARVGARPGEEEGDPLVEEGAALAAEPAEARVARHEGAAGDGLRDGGGERARDAHDANTAAARRGRDSRD